jgi:hypothetical protein
MGYADRARPMAGFFCSTNRLSVLSLLPAEPQLPHCQERLLREIHAPNALQSHLPFFGFPDSSRGRAMPPPDPSASPVFRGASDHPVEIRGRNVNRCPLPCGTPGCCVELLRPRANLRGSEPGDARGGTPNSSIAAAGPVFPALRPGARPGRRRPVECAGQNSVRRRSSRLTICWMRTP